MDIFIEKTTFIPLWKSQGQRCFFFLMNNYYKVWEWFYVVI